MSELLVSIKELLGVPTTVTEFDSQIVMHINSVFIRLNLLNVGVIGYQITSTAGSITEFLPSSSDDSIFNMVLMYIFMKVRIVFDPPSSSFVMTALDTQIKELEWLLTDYNASLIEEPVV